MSSNYKHWQKLFLFCLGLTIGTAICMKLLEADFLVNGQKFTIIGLEITDSRERVVAIISGMNEHVKAILRYQLYFDFAFMAGVYPGIAALLMMAREKINNVFIKKILLVLALLQIVAWGCDIAENRYLLTWIKSPVIGNEFKVYHLIVYSKWLIALLGALIAIPLVIKRKKQV